MPHVPEHLILAAVDEGLINGLAAAGIVVGIIWVVLAVAGFIVSLIAFAAVYRSMKR